jgi:aspartate aminotransferase-like enzyme
MRLWIPGPTHVRPELLAQCARPMIGHRSAAMEQWIARLDPHLKLAFGLAPASEAIVAVHTSSATGLMEAALLGCGRRVLALVTGAFGARWAEIAELVGKDVERLEAPWGEAVPPEELERALAERGPFDAVALISNETSTGVRAPLDDYASVLREHPHTLLLVDLVSWLAGDAADFDARGMDFAFAGTQKALALPPGVTVLCASKRYLEQARLQPRRGFYLDPVLILEGHASRKTPSTPCIPLYFALARQLEDIGAGALEGGTVSGAQGWQARFERHRRMQQRTAAWAAEQGLRFLPAEPLRSLTVSCLEAGGLDVPALLAELKRRGHQPGNGYGKLKDKTFRIGHMGDHLESDLAELLGHLSEAIALQRR